MSEYDDENHLIIGEAAFYLAVRHADINIESLIEELAEMAFSDNHPARAGLIADAVSWLRRFSAFPCEKLTEPEMMPGLSPGHVFLH